MDNMTGHEARFREDYKRAETRADELAVTLARHYSGGPDPLPCPVEMLMKHMAVLDELLKIMEARALVEHIDLA